MNDRNTVAILLATYNGEKYITEQLESLRKQTYANFKCYIHDDGSTDNTISAIKDFIKKCNDNRFSLVVYENEGGNRKFPVANKLRFRIVYNVL